MRPVPARGDQLLVGRGHRGPVDPEVVRQLPGGQQLDAGGQLPFLDQPLEVALDLAGQRDSPTPDCTPFERNPHGPTIPAILVSSQRKYRANWLYLRSSNRPPVSAWYHDPPMPGLVVLESMWNRQGEPARGEAPGPRPPPGPTQHPSLSR